MNWPFHVFVMFIVSFFSVSSLAQDSDANKTDSKIAKSALSLSEGSVRQLLVRFDDNLTDEQVDEINRRLGATVIKRMFDGRLHLVELHGAGPLQDLQRAYEATSGVKYAEPNLVMELHGDGRTGPSDSSSGSPRCPERLYNSMVPSD